MKRVWVVLTLSLVLFGCAKDNREHGVVEPPKPVKYMGVMPINDGFTLENWQVVRVGFRGAGINAQTDVWNQWWLIYLRHRETSLCAVAYLQTFGGPTEPQPAGLTVFKLFSNDDLPMIMVEWSDTKKREMFSVPPPMPIDCDKMLKPKDEPPSATGYATAEVSVSPEAKADPILGRPLSGGEIRERAYNSGIAKDVVRQLKAGETQEMLDYDRSFDARIRAVFVRQGYRFVVSTGVFQGREWISFRWWRDGEWPKDVQMVIDEGLDGTVDFGTGDYFPFDRDRKLGFQVFGAWQDKYALCLHQARETIGR